MKHYNVLQSNHTKEYYSSIQRNSKWVEDFLSAFAILNYDNNRRDIDSY